MISSLVLKKRDPVPFRESNLTKLLIDSLGAPLCSARPSALDCRPAQHAACDMSDRQLDRRVCRSACLAGSVALLAAAKRTVS